MKLERLTASFKTSKDIIIILIKTVTAVTKTTLINDRGTVECSVVFGAESELQVYSYFVTVTADNSYDFVL